MLSPPSQGSEVVDVLKDNGLFKQVNGPAGGQLGTDPVLSVSALIISTYVFRLENGPPY